MERLLSLLAAVLWCTLIGCAEPPESHKTSLPTKYIVQKGESLSTIARKFYGEKNTAWWQHIYRHNSKLLRGFENLSVGQVLIIPQPPEEGTFRYESDLSKLSSDAHSSD
jgi:hypothetical protein